MCIWIQCFHDSVLTHPVSDLLFPSLTYTNLSLFLFIFHLWPSSWITPALASVLPGKSHDLFSSPVSTEMHTNNATPIGMVSSECQGWCFDEVWLMLWSERHLTLPKGSFCLLLAHSLHKQGCPGVWWLWIRPFPTNVVVIQKGKVTGYIWYSDLFTQIPDKKH